MYNRYIPQSDGTYRKSKVQDHRPEPPKPPVQQEPPQRCEPEMPAPLPCPPELPKHHHRPAGGSSVSGFLRQLLPKDFDTGDLMVILLLLLMAGDCEEEQNTALLTLALYLFM